ncbi:MAG: hypothetical protein H6581_31645 [Bacteroidia bacterium]|nr:hypothetical protein [Bacteroidia bacterium]
MEGRSLAPPAFQLDDGPGLPGEGGSPIQRYVAGEGECLHTTPAPGSAPVRNILTAIYNAGGGENVAEFVGNQTETAINQAFTLGEESIRVDDEAMALASHPDQGPGRYDHVAWDREGYEEGEEGSWRGSHLTPVETEEDSPTLRDAFHQHREAEIARLAGPGVTAGQVLGAQQLATAQGSPALAEAARRVLFTANEYAVINTLNPAQSERYRPTGDTTFCNIYVWDVLRSMGVSERAIPGGNADSFAEFTASRRGSRYWRRLAGPDQAQERANAGRLVIITAVGVRFAGHVSLIPPENPGHGSHAHRDAEGHVDSPLESNAGGGSMIEEGGETRPSANWRYENREELYAANPEHYSSGREAQWWEHGHTNAGFYEYIGAVGGSDAAGSASSMGVTGGL